MGAEAVSNQGTSIWRGLVVAALAGATVAACLWALPPPSRSEAGIDMNLPDSVNGFRGTDQEVSASELAILPRDTEFAKKLYRNERGDQISCQTVLAGGEKRSIHRPEVCLPAQGWSVKTGEVIQINLGNGKNLDVMKLVIAKKLSLVDGQPRDLTSLFLYWFVGKDATTPHHVVRLLRTNLDMLLHNTNHRWAYVIVSTPVLEGIAPQGKNAEQTLVMLEDFIARLAPDIMKQDVQPMAPIPHDPSEPLKDN
jgi:EpsI family protein